MSKSTQQWCLRCEREVEVAYRHSPRKRKLMKGYLLIPIALLPVYPFAAADWVFCIPILMAYMMGIGPALSIVRDPATCSDCGAFVPKAK